MPKITLKQCWLWRWLVIPSEEIHFSDLVNMIQLKTIGKTSIFRHENILKFCPNWISTMYPWDAFGVLKLLPYNTIQCMENIVQSIGWRSSPMKLSLSCSTTPPRSYLNDFGTYLPVDCYCNYLNMFIFFYAFMLTISFYLTNLLFL